MIDNNMEDLIGLRVLLGVSSSIAAYRALDVASALRKRGAEVRAVLSANVPELVSPAAFDAITHQRTVSGLWGSDHAGEMDHLAATKWADVFAIVPATANTIGLIAHGIAPDALSTFVLAWNKAPLLIAPAMNPEMWRNGAVQANVKLLRERGHEFIGPARGRMACDDVGDGRLAPVEEIVEAIARRHLSKGRLAGRRVLITSGPTREYADDVRCITNPSTGKQGMALVRAVHAEGGSVVLVSGPSEVPVPSGVERVRRIQSADEMLAAVLEELPNVDLAIFAAAVSDWKPAERIIGKEKKTAVPGEVSLTLVRTPDIAATANQKRRPEQLFVGFAAESQNLEGYAGEKMLKKGFALVFANPINEAGAGFGSDTNRGLILRDDGTKRDVPGGTKDDIARLLIDEIVVRLNAS
ncbi:bifunctional phosphopantothenoylcysteine decarboxylase/phosphopantothenate--cysteine ligase CoaBC [bacterium]|nr:bifunctional phosphopantothenoylcysteine decarboxylase/phosphopantothenate--cysteine ligase CoaBC [bacterium]